MALTHIKSDPRSGKLGMLNKDDDDDDDDDDNDDDDDDDDDRGHSCIILINIVMCSLGKTSH